MTVKGGIGNVNDNSVYYICKKSQPRKAHSF